jgi:hypothetical protein
MTRLILLTFLTFSTVPAYGEWVQVIQDVEGQTVYFDPSTIQRDRDIAKMWALYDSKTAQPAVGKAYLSRKVLTEYNCAHDMKRMVRVIEYSGNMGNGEVVHMNSSFFSTANWMPAYTGIGHTLLKVACGEK